MGEAARQLNPSDLGINHETRSAQEIEAAEREARQLLGLEDESREETTAQPLRVLEGGRSKPTVNEKETARLRAKKKEEREQTKKSWQSHMEGTSTVNVDLDSEEATALRQQIQAMDAAEETPIEETFFAESDSVDARNKAEWEDRKKKKKWYQFGR